MLISKTENEEQSETAVNSTQPVCPNCGAARESILEQVPSPASFIISFVSLFYFGIWCIFIIPLVFQSTKMIIKRCYYCNQELEKRKYFQLPNINDQVLQFRFGNCIVVVSRKYALVLLTIIVCLFFYFEYFTEKEQPQIEANIYSNKTWVDFLQFCGKFQFIDNGLKARHQFETYFKDKIVSWKGDFIQTKPNHDPNFSFNYWVYLKMDPTESTEDLPDIIVGVRDSQYQIETFQKLEKGKPIHFEAKFLFLGSEYNFHILELKHLTVIPSELVEDIKQLHQFTLDMDQFQKLKRSKLQESLKHKIHMYNPKQIPGIQKIIESIQTANNTIAKTTQENVQNEENKQEQSDQGDNAVIENQNVNQQEDNNNDVNEVNEAVNEQDEQEKQFDPSSVNIKIDESIRNEILSKDSGIVDGVIDDDDKSATNQD
ncbi:unnamed protein product (macronuclear) [Paramecium tetraurelia]|uniref:LITAF domain-containing protein n=1 Tax=Paramecium tetraurelia TaxID=5888 RepID=A0CKA3_PARTE|nr:uncharacterized protein GSPATT00000933001 [Paramecium tetraurelia]CAK71220.1 unnamed protein product [Paramecium tetraurelia]|eukprot:XP_001438617.1 hypothetical protein (macronuclear) [Paramecium tetraurelia strain d4-2]